VRGNRIVLVWVESVLAVATGVLGVVTVFWHDWIEILSGWDPDHYSGSVEVGLVVVLLIFSVTCAALARRTYRRVVAQSG
jgi:hypothetical protein